MDEAVEVVGTPSRLINGVWEPIDEYGNVISNNRTTKRKQRMSGKPWIKTSQTSVNGEQIWAKTAKGKKGPVLMLGVPSDVPGEIKRVSLKYLETGVHPVRKPRQGRAKVGARPLHLEGGTRREYLLARKKFLAAESPAQRRKDRKTTETLVYTADAYDPMVNDFPGLDEYGYRSRARWNSKAKDYIARAPPGGKSGRKIDPQSYQGQVMAWNRAKRMAKKHGLPEPPKPVRRGPLPAYLLKKQKKLGAATGVSLSSGQLAAIMDLGSIAGAKRGIDDDGEYDPSMFKRSKF